MPKTKPAPKHANGTINKSAVIRELIASGLKKQPEIMAALAKRGIKCNSSLISQMLHPDTEKARQLRRKKTREDNATGERSAALKRSAAIRELIKAGKSPTEIIAALAKRGIEVSPITIYRVAGYDRRHGHEIERKRMERARKRGDHVSANGEAPKTEMDRAFEIAKEFGGVRNLQAVLKRLRKLVR